MESLSFIISKAITNLFKKKPLVLIMAMDERKINVQSLAQFPKTIMKQ